MHNCNESNAEPIYLFLVSYIKSKDYIYKKNVILPVLCMDLSHIKGRTETVLENSMLKRISKE
jgi:hypothetical protein